MIVALGCLVAIPSAASVAANLKISKPSDALKSRLIVLTDIEADPDDTQSLTRLLLYSNDINLEGLIATTSVHQKSRVAPESIREVIANYAKVRNNLLLHDSTYPNPATLSALVSTGQTNYGMAGVGLDKETDGSRRIIAALERPDPRPLWIAVWGGPNTLAQALLTLRATRSPAELKRLLSKLRIYAISDQDDTGPWIRREFPSLFYIVSPGGYGSATWTGINSVIDGIDNTTISNEWLAKRIQQGHGALGAGYPDTAYGMEGDTPSFLSLIPNGLNEPERPDWGGWGGRYALRTPLRRDTDPDGFNGGVRIPQEMRPIWTNTVDTVTPLIAKSYGITLGSTGKSFKGFRETIWRWRDDFQSDFASRMDWTTKEPARSNHPPIVRLAGPDRLTVRSGDWVSLSARGTSDPDGDSLSYQWFEYPEISTCIATIQLPGAANLYERKFVAPEEIKPCEHHFVLRVTDKGDPPLSRYRRVIVTILPK